MKKGVVLSVNKRYITLLTPEGEFVKSTRQNRPYEIGDEISFTSVEKSIFSRFHFSYKKVAVISAFATSFLLFSIVVPRFSNHVSAYMTIDVNPSIELGLNNELQVVELNGLNADGKHLIGKLEEWKNEEISTVAKKIVTKTKELGYLNDSTRKIIVSTTIIDEDKKLDRELSQEINTMSKQMPLPNTEVKILQATENDRNKAKQRGISTGKYIEQQLKEENKIDNDHQDHKSKGDSLRPIAKANKEKIKEKSQSSTKKELVKNEKANIVQHTKGQEQKNVKYIKKKMETKEKPQRVVQPKMKSNIREDKNEGWKKRKEAQQKVDENKPSNKKINNKFKGNNAKNHNEKKKYDNKQEDSHGKRDDHQENQDHRDNHDEKKKYDNKQEDSHGKRDDHQENQDHRDNHDYQDE